MYIPTAPVKQHGEAVTAQDKGAFDGIALQLFESDDETNSIPDMMDTSTHPMMDPMDIEDDDDEEDVEVDVCCPKCTKPLRLRITKEGELFLSYHQKSNKGNLFTLSTSGTSIENHKKRKLA